MHRFVFLFDILLKAMQLTVFVCQEMASVQLEAALVRLCRMTMSA